ncbi:MAG: putative lipid II flippase FtsW [Clostridia bacterium]|nr:putative lipid II flippase FtsW [Clostridia bacterium]MBR4261137.1 putative lipid II flippase FtsW [Clostridia bacterium]
MRKKDKKVSNFVNNQFDFILCLTVFILLAMGIIMILSASAPSALSTTGNSYTFVKKQFIFAAIGVVLMFIVSKIDYRFYKKYYWPIYFASWMILLLVLVPSLGVSVKGATRWVDLKFTQFQPSELTKIGMIIFYAGYLTDHKSELTDFWRGFVKPLCFIIPPIAILFGVQNHLSVSLVIAIITVTMMVMAGCRVQHFAASGGVGILGLGSIIGMLQMSGKGGFRLDRISTFFNPWADAQGTGYQMVQSLYAIGSGGFFGVGLGESKQKYLYIPEPHNDFIFAILAEELGFVGCLFVIALFAIFVWRGILVSMKAPDMFGSLIAIGITTLIGAQAIINIAVVTATIPTTGMALPFFSYGGTALLILLCNVGILLNISRASSKV